MFEDSSRLGYDVASLANRFATFSKNGEVRTSGSLKNEPAMERRIRKELDPKPLRHENPDPARYFIFIDTVMFRILRAITTCEHTHTWHYSM